MQYFVNSIFDENERLHLKSNVSVIGLFKADDLKCDTDSDERAYYHDVILLAYYAIVNNYARCREWIPKGVDHLSEISNAKYYSTIQVASLDSTQYITADSDKEAVRKFFKEDFHDNMKVHIRLHLDDTSLAEEAWVLHFREHKELTFTTRHELEKYLSGEDSENGYITYDRVPDYIEHITYYDVAY